jgi:tRNA-modifying protein YgfZ
VAAIDIQADRLAAEYGALTESCGLVDRSERGKLALSGLDAKAFLAGQVTNDIEALQPRRGCYAAFLTHKGKMLGDMRVLDVDAPDRPPAEGRAPSAGAREAGPKDADRPEDGQPSAGEQLLLDTERTSLQALFDMIRRYKIGYDVQLRKRTLESGLLSLIGPHAARLAGAEGLGEQEHENMPLAIEGATVLAVRTDIGVDLICDASQAAALAQALYERGASPASERAAEIVRVERGRPRYGVDLDDSVIPQEAGLNERAVSFTKGCYVGQETVARLYYKGKPNRHLRGLRLSERAPAGGELRLGERAVGRLTSAVVSPAYGPIGLALVRREAEPGTRVSVGPDAASAEVVELPFGAS